MSSPRKRHATMWPDEIDRPNGRPRPKPKPIAWGEELKSLWEDAKFGLSAVALTLLLEGLFWGLVIR